MPLKVLQERELIEGVTYDLCFDWLDDRGRTTDGHVDYGSFAFKCDKDGNVDMVELSEPEKACALDSYQKCVAGTIKSGRPGFRISKGYVRSWPFSYWTERVIECEICKGNAFLQRGCGAYVCTDCDHHQGLCRCFCGWSTSGGDGREELEELGEVIDPG